MLMFMLLTVAMTFKDCTSTVSSTGSYNYTKLSSSDTVYAPSFTWTSPGTNEYVLSPIQVKCKKINLLGRELAAFYLDLKQIQVFDNVLKPLNLRP